MKLANERRIGRSAPVPKALDNLLARLDRLSMASGFGVQRQAALRLALQVYFEPGGQALLSPLPEEVELADLLLYADFYPEDGQLTLIEQLRDVITEHIPEEQRAWLDPLKHSYMDVVEVLPKKNGTARRPLRSVGNGRLYEIPTETLDQDVPSGQMILTRLVREPGDPETLSAVSAGPMLLLPAEDAKALYETTAEERRDMEVLGGSFELGEWPEFAKRFGHLLLRNFARLRVAALLEAVGEIRYRTAAGTTCFYVLALYEHHAFASITEGIGALEGWREERPTLLPGMGAPEKLRRWILPAIEGGSADVMAARVTVTGTELFLECDSRERLDAIKHALAAAFGFSLHFRGETDQPPVRRVTQEELAREQPLTLVVTDEEDHALVNAFLETVYLEWADRSSPALGGETPRHAVMNPDRKQRVEALIHEMEQTDLGLVRTGVAAFDYDKLRAHVGLC